MWSKYGVLVLTADSSFADPTTMAGKALGFVEQIRATAGNEVKAHDVWRGKLDKAHQKKWPGGPAPFGKRLCRTVVVDGRGREVADSVLADDPATDWIVLKAYAVALANLGRGGGFVAEILNADEGIPPRYKPFRGDTVSYWLDNPIWRGAYRWAVKCTGIRNDARVQQENPDGPEWVEDFCPARVSRADWDKLQSFRRRRGEAVRAAREKNRRTGDGTGAVGKQLAARDRGTGSRDAGCSAH